jgi:hypothetical protein
MCRLDRCISTQRATDDGQLHQRALFQAHYPSQRHAPTQFRAMNLGGTHRGFPGGLMALNPFGGLGRNLIPGRSPFVNLPPAALRACSMTARVARRGSAFSASNCPVQFRAFRKSAANCAHEFGSGRRIVVTCYIICVPRIDAPYAGAPRGTPPFSSTNSTPTASKARRTVALIVLIAGR